MKTLAFFPFRNRFRNLSFPVLLTLLILSLSACMKSERSGSGTNGSNPETLLLKNYRPHSIYHIPVTKVDRAEFPVLDMHSHDYAGSLAGLDEWVRTMDETGIERVAILSKEHGASFDSLVKVYSKYPGRFELWCGIDYTAYKEPDFAEKAISELIRCHELGASGVGELGDKGRGLYYSKPEAIGMHPDDPRMDPVWEKCGQLGMPVNIHIADPEWMYETMDSTNDGLMNAYKWRLDNQPGIASHQEMIDILERTVKKHPGTTFIACHLANCSYDLDKAAALLDKYPNLYMDISARYAEICAIPRAARAFIEKYQDRLVYGTDMGRDPGMYRFTFRLLQTADEHIYDPDFSYHWALSALSLADSTLEKLYRLNALKIMKNRATSPSL